MVGITEVIKKKFAPTYKYKKLISVPKNPGGLKKRAAQRRGKRLDLEIFNISKDKLQRKPCAETKNLLNKLKEMDLEIVESQKYVALNHLNTYIDLIVKDKSNKLYICEIKRGCHYRLCSTKDGKLKYQSKNLSDCPLYQHQMQTLIGRWLYQTSQKTSEPIGVLLFYIDESNIEVFTEEQFMATLTQEGCQVLMDMSNNQKTRKIKKAKKV